MRHTPLCNTVCTLQRYVHELNIKVKSLEQEKAALEEELRTLALYFGVKERDTIEIIPEDFDKKIRDEIHNHIECIRHFDRIQILRIISENEDILHETKLKLMQTVNQLTVYKHIAMYITSK